HKRPLGVGQRLSRLPDFVVYEADAGLRLRLAGAVVERPSLRQSIVEETQRLVMLSPIRCLPPAVEQRLDFRSRFGAPFLGGSRDRYQAERRGKKGDRLFERSRSGMWHRFMLLPGARSGIEIPV